MRERGANLGERFGIAEGVRQREVGRNPALFGVGAGAYVRVPPGRVGRDLKRPQTLVALGDEFG